MTDDKRRLAYLMLKRRLVMRPEYRRDIAGQCIASGVFCARMLVFIATRRLLGTSEIERRAIRHAGTSLRKRAAVQKEIGASGAVVVEIVEHQPPTRPGG